MVLVYLMPSRGIKSHRVIFTRQEYEEREKNRKSIIEEVLLRIRKCQKFIVANDTRKAADGQLTALIS